MTIKQLIDLKIFSGYDVALETDEDLYNPTRFNLGVMGNYNVVQIMAMPDSQATSRARLYNKIMIIISNSSKPLPLPSKKVISQIWDPKSLTWQQQQQHASFSDFENYYNNLGKGHWIDEMQVIDKDEFFIQISKSK